MDLTFDIGDPQAPRGHALLYFRSPDGRKIMATYLIALPIVIEPTKYVPPIFAGRLPAAVEKVTATALPPLPEEVESYEHLRRLAEARHDDLIDGGEVAPEQLDRLLYGAQEAAHEYAQLYQRYIERLPEPAREPEPDEDQVRYLLMSERERLEELSRLTGTLRYAVEGRDSRLMAETVRRMQMLARYLPEKYRVNELIAAAQEPGERGTRLSALFLDRSFKLCNERYEELPALEQQIRELQGT
jgi:hypothetical protein